MNDYERIGTVSESEEGELSRRIPAQAVSMQGSGDTPHHPLNRRRSLPANLGPFQMHAAIHVHERAGIPIVT